MNPYSKTITTMVALGGIALAAGLSLVACEGGTSRKVPPLVRGRTLDVALGQISIYEGDHFYTVRQQPWSLYAWLDAVEQESGLLVDRTSGDPEAPLIDLRQPRKNADTEPERTEMVTWSAAPHTLVHFGARPIFAPAPAPATAPAPAPAPAPQAGLPHRGRTVSDSLLQATIGSLPADGFLASALAAGWIDTVYWVQPDISCFRGLAESVSFDLEERDGRWTPRVEPGAVPIDPLELTRSAFEGRPLPRLFPLEIATGHRVEDWADGPIHLQALDLSELQRSNLAGSPNVWVEVDLDYFGTVPPLASAGYLALSDESDYGVGLLGPGAPVFRESPSRARDRAHEVARAIKRIAPGAVVLVESPEWMQADIAPDVESILRGVWTAADSSATDPPRVPSVFLREGSGRVELEPECPQSVDVGVRDSLRVELRWDGVPGERMEVSLFAERSEESDRRLAQWITLGDRPAVDLTIPLPPAEAALRPRWSIETRRLRDGCLMFHGAVAIERSGAALAQLVREQQETVDPAFPDAQALRERSATDLLSWGMQSRIPVRLLHEILMAHPGTLADRCGSLRAHWIARASRPAEP